jgi:hypothetical protein
VLCALVLAALLFAWRWPDADAIWATLAVLWPAPRCSSNAGCSSPRPSTS